jgi:hypothetical protein
MITVYIFILTFSAWLGAYGLLKVGQRITLLISRTLRLPAGLFALACVTLFLVVVGAPASLLVGVILLALFHFMNTLYYLPKLAQWGIPFLAALLAVGGGGVPVVAGLPQPLVQAAMLALLMAIVWGSARTPTELAPASAGWLACLFPVLLAPLFGAPSFLALDSALIAAALLGALMAAPADARMSIARAPFALLIGWLMLQPAAHGVAWASALGLLIYGVFLLAQRPTRAIGTPHAAA